MLTRREFLKLSAATGGALYLSTHWKLIQRAMAAQGTWLPGSAIPQFVDPLPLLSVAGGPLHTIIAGADEIELHMREFQANVMPSTFVPATGPYTGTWVWGYIVGPDAPT